MRSSQQGPPGSNGPSFRVLCDDNYERGDESVLMGEFADYESALDKCRTIVDGSLRHHLEPGMSAGDLFAAYRLFGEDPFVVPTPEGVERFSAWKYAEERCQELCPAEARKIPPLDSPEARKVEWQIPSDYDFLDERPNAPADQGFVVIDGKRVDLAGPVFPT